MKLPFSLDGTPFRFIEVLTSALAASINYDPSGADALRSVDRISKSDDFCSGSGRRAEWIHNQL